MTNFADEVDAEDAAARRAAVESILPIYEWRQTEKAVKAQIAAHDASASDYGKMSPLRRWLTDHDGEDLDDLEAGLVARLKPGGAEVYYDSPTAIKDKNQGLFDRLVSLNCFEIDKKMLAAQIKAGRILAADIDPWRHSGLKTPSLVIEEAK